MSGVYGATGVVRSLSYAHSGLDVSMNGYAGLSPVPAGFPDPGSAGLSDPTLLTNIGAKTYAVGGEVISNKRIYGSVHVTADDVEFHNCEFNTIDGFYGIDATGQGTIVEDCHFKGTVEISRGYLDGGYSQFRRNIVEGSVDGVSMEQGSIFEDNLIWNLAPYDPILDTHNDGIQGGTTRNIQVLHNTIIVPSGSTSCILTGGAETRLHSINVTIDGNYFYGGCGIMLYLTEGDGNVIDDLPCEDIVVTNNTFDFHEENNFGYVALYEPGAPGHETVFSGNVKGDGSPLSLEEAIAAWEGLG
jgi:hypothetical protein